MLGLEPERGRQLAELQVEVDQARASCGAGVEVVGEVGGEEGLAAPAGGRDHGDDLAAPDRGRGRPGRPAEPVPSGPQGLDRWRRRWPCRRPAGGGCRRRRCGWCRAGGAVRRRSKARMRLDSGSRRRSRRSSSRPAVVTTLGPAMSTSTPDARSRTSSTAPRPAQMHQLGPGPQRRRSARPPGGRDLRSRPERGLGDAHGAYSALQGFGRPGPGGHDRRLALGDQVEVQLLELGEVDEPLGVDRRHGQQVDEAGAVGLALDGRKAGAVDVEHLHRLQHELDPGGGAVRRPWRRRRRR